MNAAQVVQLFKALMQGPASRVELAERANANPKVVGKLLAELKAEKMAYVIGYSAHTDGRNRVKIYAMGEGEDAKPLATQSQVSRSRKSYLKKVQTKKQATIKTTFVGGKGLWQ